MLRRCMICLCWSGLMAGAGSASLDWIVVSKEGSGFAAASSGQPFLPRGFNYDHDDAQRLIEDYWENEWPRVESDFAEMRALGANVVRVHLQLGRFMTGPDTPNTNALVALDRLIQLAERTGLYLDLTGLGCYHKQDVPPWYDPLSETARWETQASFWSAIAERCAGTPAVFCYDLMNEPVVPGGSRRPGEWLGPPFAGKHFVQFIALAQAGRPRPEIARQWIRKLKAAIRRHDQRHLVTVGLVDWSLNRPGLTSGFEPDRIAADLDFLAVHIYPEKSKVDAALETLRGFAVGKPVLIEETFPLRCSLAEFEEFLRRSTPPATGWIGFYWGRTIEDYRRQPNPTIGDGLTLAWLELFTKLVRPEVPSSR